MFDIITTADAVTRWAGLGVKFPKALASAVEVFEAIRYVEVEYPAVFDLEGVTAANAEAKVREFANQLLPTLGVAPTGGAPRSALAEAKQQALDIAARDVLSKARAAVPEIIEQLTPAFAKAATEFAEAVEALPTDLSDSAIVQAGPAVLTEYHRAMEAQAAIAKYDSWLASLSQLPGLRYQPDPETRVLSRRPKNTNGSFGQLNPNYVAAVREGIAFVLTTAR